MIDHFEPVQPLEPENKDHLQWTAALGAPLIAGLILLIVPGGIPWSALSFFSPVIMGRAVPDHWNLPLSVAIFFHFAIALVYGLIIALAVMRLTQWRAILAGGALGLILYGINFWVVSLWIPELRGSEPTALLAHVVFGLTTAAAYRGLLRRRPVAAAS